MLRAGRGGQAVVAAAGLLFPLLLGVLAPAVSLLAERLGDGCGHTVLNQESGTLTSKNYPGTYPNNTRCKWNIRVTPGKNIILNLADLDIEARSCDLDYLKIMKGSSEEIGTYCGRLHPEKKEIRLDTNEITIHFESDFHISGRGFLLSYATSDHSDLISCLDISSHYSEAQYSKYCPAGCKDVAGDVFGDVVDGYRDTSALCKAAIHAGIIADELGGQITVIQRKGIGRYKGVTANSITTKEGSLSDKLFLFNSTVCNKNLGMESGAITDGQITASSSWQWTSDSGEVIQSSADRARLNIQGPAWVSADLDSSQWLEIDLKERMQVTGIVITGSTDPKFYFYVKAYKIQYSKDRNKWKFYKGASSSEEKIFMGNTDHWQPTRNNFIPPVVTRYIRIIPLQWQQRIAMKVELLGCQVTRSTDLSAVIEDQNITEPASPKETDLEHVPPHSDLGTDVPAVIEDQNVTEPVSSKDTDFGMKLAVTVVPAVLFLFLLLAAICIYRTLRRKKTKGEAYGLSDAQNTGCWKQITHPFVRHQSTEFTISYDHEKPLHKLDLVTYDMADYHEPVTIGTVTRKGSTFKPMDTEAMDELGKSEIESHYDCPHTATRHEYALPLTNQEPEYATPIIERHAVKNIYTSKTGYKVPNISLAQVQTSSSSGGSFNNSSTSDSSGGSGYQIPQCLTDSKRNEKMKYDQPKLINLTTEGCTSDYQKPQSSSAVTGVYSTPRDCLKSMNHGQQ